MNDERAAGSPAPPEDVVRKTVTVPRAQRDAFQLWTAQIHRWWPAGHSISGDRATRVVLEGREGGRFYEQTSEGAQHDWGRVLVWQPPQRLVFHWYLGSGPQLPTRVEVHFVPLDAQNTRIEVEHRGPDLIGELWQRNKGRYSAAWDAVLGALAQQVREDRI